MKNITKYLALMLVALFALTAVSATEVSDVVKVNKAQINGLNLGSSELHTFVRGSELDLELDLVGLDNFEDLELEAHIAGYAHNDDTRGLSAVQVFNVRDGITQRRNLELRLPQDLDEGEYTLTLSFTARNAEALRIRYKFDVSAPDHAVRVKDLIVTPTKQVRAGEAILVKARLANVGSGDETVRVAAVVEELGTSQATYLDITAGEEQTTEELFLPLDACAAEGTHTVELKLEYNNGRSGSTATHSIDVLPGDCDGQPASKSGKSSARSFLENVLLVLVVLVLIVALIVGFSRMRSDEE